MTSDIPMDRLKHYHEIQRQREEEPFHLTQYRDQQIAKIRKLEDLD